MRCPRPSERAWGRDSPDFVWHDDFVCHEQVLWYGAPALFILPGKLGCPGTPRPFVRAALKRPFKLWRTGSLLSRTCYRPRRSPTKPRGEAQDPPAWPRPPVINQGADLPRCPDPLGPCPGLAPGGGGNLVSPRAPPGPPRPPSRFSLAGGPCGVAVLFCCTQRSLLRTKVWGV